MYLQESFNFNYNYTHHFKRSFVINYVMHALFLLILFQNQTLKFALARISLVSLAFILTLLLTLLESDLAHFRSKTRWVIFVKTHYTQKSIKEALLLQWHWRRRVRLLLLAYFISLTPALLQLIINLGKGQKESLVLLIAFSGIVIFNYRNYCRMRFRFKQANERLNNLIKRQKKDT